MNVRTSKLKYWLGLIMVITLSSCMLSRNSSVEDRLPAGWIEASLEVDGLTRWYRIYTPNPLPEDPSVVLYLHGGTLSMRSIFSPLANPTSTWLRIAEEEGVVLIVPNGVNAKTGDTYGNEQNWNDLRRDTSAGQHQVNDVKFLLVLLDRVAADLSLSHSKVFVTGASNGGMMTYRLLVDLPGRFDAGAAFIANMPVLDQPLPEVGQPTPIMIANGTLDPLVPWEGGVVGKDRGEVVSTRETVDWWIDANQADPNLVQVDILPDISLEDGCLILREYNPPLKGGAPVLFYSFDGGGHTLPTLAAPGLFERISTRIFGPVCHDADGVLLAWNFFREVSGLP